MQTIWPLCWSLDYTYHSKVLCAHCGKYFQKVEYVIYFVKWWNEIHFKKCFWCIFNIFHLVKDLIFEMKREKSAIYCLNAYWCFLLLFIIKLRRVCSSTNTEDAVIASTLCQNCFLVTLQCILLNCHQLFGFHWPLNVNASLSLTWALEF